MKAIVIPVTIFLLISLNSFSQNNIDKGSFAVSIGPAFPVGAYAAKDLSKPSSGFAKIGQSASVTYDRLLEKHFGFSAALHLQRNPLNTKAFETIFSQTKIYQGFWAGSPNQPPPSLPYTIYPNWKFEKRSWFFGSLRLGAFAQFYPKGSSNIVFITKAMIGVIYAASPRLVGNSITDTATAHIEQSKSSAFGFTYSVSGGIKYNLHKRVFLLTNLEFMGTNNIRFRDVKVSIITFKGSPGSPDYSGQQSLTTTDGKQVISSLNINIGIGLRL
jgi:hypothetical protein